MDFEKELEKLYELKEKGILSEEEFQAKKEEILNSSDFNRPKTESTYSSYTENEPKRSKKPEIFASLSYYLGLAGFIIMIICAAATAFIILGSSFGMNFQNTHHHSYNAEAVLVPVLVGYFSIVGAVIALTTSIPAMVFSSKSRDAVVNIDRSIRGRKFSLWGIIGSSAVIVANIFAFIIFIYAVSRY